MKALSPRVSREIAWARLTRGGFWQRLIRAVRRKVPPPDSVREPGQLPHLETVWLPNYRVSLTAEPTGESAGRERTRSFDALVDAHSGRVVLAELAASAWIEWATAPQATKHSASEARELARLAVQKSLLSRGGWRKPPAIVEIRPPELIGYPVWAYYFQTRTGMLDAKLLDAMSGAVGGPQLKSSLLATLAGLQQHPSSRK